MKYPCLPLVRLSLALALAAVALPLQAVDVPAVDSAANLGRTMLGLGVVIALVFALAWVARRVSSARGSRSR